MSVLEHANAWTVVSHDPDPHRPNARIVQLMRPGMRAEVHLYGRGRRMQALVSFSSTAIARSVSSVDAYSTAEAHRFCSMLFDTIGDLGHQEDALEVTTRGVLPGVSVHHADGCSRWVSVEVDGPDAVAAITPYFGDEFADEFA